MVDTLLWLRLVLGDNTAGIIDPDIGLVGCQIRPMANQVLCHLAGGALLSRRLFLGVAPLRKAMQWLVQWQQFNTNK